MTRKDFVSFLIAIVLMSACLLAGCGGSGNGGASSPVALGGESQDSGALKVICPFQESRLASRDTYSGIQYYVISVHRKGTEEPLVPAMRVDRSDSGSQGSALFESLPLGEMTMVAKGYTEKNLLTCENWQDITLKPGTDTETVVVEATAGPAPTGFKLQRVLLSQGNGTASIENFGPSQEATVLINYNSKNPDIGSLNEIKATGSVINTGVSGKRLTNANREKVRPRPTPKKEVPFPDDITRLTENAAACVNHYGIPRPVSRERLSELKRMDSQGNYQREAVGDKKNFKWGSDALPCTCRYSGTHSVIYLDDADPKESISQEYLDSIGHYFDNVTWQKAEELVDTVTSLRWSDRFCLLFSSKVEHNAVFRPLDEYDESEAPYSNQCDMAYFNPLLSEDGIVPTIRDWDGIVAHEFQHLMRWYRTIYQSGHAHYDELYLSQAILYDGALDEGLSQYFELMVGRGLFYGDAISKLHRVNAIRTFLSEPHMSPFTGGGSSHALGFLMICYLYDHYGGMEVLKKLDLAGSRLGFDAIEDVTGEKASLLYAKFSMALRFSTEPGINQPYTFNTIDLSGNTAYYQDKGFFPARTYKTNTNDFSRGVDLAEANYLYSLEGTSTYEWASQYLRFFNGSGENIVINLQGYLPTSLGQGDISIYVLSRSQ